MFNTHLLETLNMVLHSDLLVLCGSFEGWWPNNTKQFEQKDRGLIGLIKIFSGFAGAHKLFKLQYWWLSQGVLHCQELFYGNVCYCRQGFHFALFVFLERVKVLVANVDCVSVYACYMAVWRFLIVSLYTSKYVTQNYSIT